MRCTGDVWDDVRGCTGDVREVFVRCTGDVWDDVRDVYG